MTRGYLVRRESAYHTSRVYLATLAPVRWTTWRSRALRFPDRAAAEEAVSELDLPGLAAVPAAGAIASGRAGGE